MTTDLQTSVQPLWFVGNLAHVHIDSKASGGRTA